MRDNFAMNRPETQKEKKSVAMAYGRHEEREEGKKTKRRRGKEEYTDGGAQVRARLSVLPVKREREESIN